MSIRIVNKYRMEPDPNSLDFYIGRGSPVGNPYRIGELTRNEVVDRYDRYMQQKVAQGDLHIMTMLHRIADEVKRGKKVRLVCFCTPQRCHGEIVKREIENLLTCV